MSRRTLSLVLAAMTVAVIGPGSAQATTSIVVCNPYACFAVATRPGQSVTGRATTNNYHANPEFLRLGGVAGPGAF